MPKKRRFCFVLPHYFMDIKGGSEIQALLIAQELLKRDWEVHYIRENSQKVGKEEQRDGMTIHSLPQRNTKLKWLNTRLLKRLMERIKADVWYCRGTFSYVFPVWSNAKKTGGKVVWACSHDAYVSKQMKKGASKESYFSKIAFTLDKFLFLKALKKTDLILLQSKNQEKLLEENWGLKGKVIYNGYPITPLPEIEREPLILWIGRLQPWKHPEKFSELAQRLKERPYKYFAIGREMGEPRFIQEFIETSKKIPNFKYLGEIEREEIFKLLEKSRLLVNTSDSEGFSNTFVEAWLNGVPVATLKVNPDNLIQKEGLGCVSLTMEQLAADVERLMENQELWEKVSQECRNFAETNFSVIDKVSSLEELIKRVDECA